MKINPQKLAAVLSLTGPERYSHFIKVAVDQGKVWGLFSGGWALAATDDGNEAFPLWPAEEYAIQCAMEQWADHQPREIDLDTLFEVLIPKLRESGTQIAVFPTPSQKGVLPHPNVVEEDLRTELGRIE